MQDDVDELVPGWQANGLSDSLIATLELSKRISRLDGVMQQAIRTEIAEFGLTYAEFDVLAALLRAGAPHRLKPSELSRALFLTSGGTSNVLQRLTSAGRIERAENPGDGRSRWVQLTPEGLRVAEAAVATAGRVHQQVMAAVPDDVVRRAADALRDINAIVGRRRSR
ncbi:MarR family winged helix-turn-helix transcriptional regulator [Nocardia sp. NBC_01009]|uniref:MarR family winged helix-turn-helix transcriptional regulator n=1 Tax=Nocardia sp. NBC_01009 TaxID=2975996 RepID=UPI00386F1AD4|nr:MarR family transcriptional regulator [Nocardia sp. NBC_01009]